MDLELIIQVDGEPAGVIRARPMYGGRDRLGAEAVTYAATVECPPAPLCEVRVRHKSDDGLLALADGVIRAARRKIAMHKRRVVCPDCGRDRPVRGDGRFSRHARAMERDGVRELELCPGSEKDAGIW